MTSELAAVQRASRRPSKLAESNVATASVDRLVEQICKLAVTNPNPDNKLPEGLPESLAQDVLLDIRSGDLRCLVLRIPTTSDKPTQSLTPREQEIARMVMKGYPNKTIAAVLDISIWTVSTHLRRMFAKLGVSTRAAMVAQLLNLSHNE